MESGCAWLPHPHKPGQGTETFTSFLCSLHIYDSVKVSATQLCDGNLGCSCFFASDLWQQTCTHCVFKGEKYLHTQRYVYEDNVIHHIVFTLFLSTVVFFWSRSSSLECLCLTTVLKNTRYFCLIHLNLMSKWSYTESKALKQNIISLIKWKFTDGSSQEDVQSLLKTFQLSTRQLHHMCGHSKVNDSICCTWRSVKLDLE